MVDPDRRPTAQEIEELIDLVRRDPASPAFIDLGEAYLALGRPRDAIQVGNLGLEAAPDNLEGRVMLARAYVAMHQWKEAQGELLRVVKVDRSNRQGFALLGEVLLRRQDYERAVPVLQHAQNLDPTSPQILSMLKRARASQPLDAPAPLPQPVPPRGETDNGAPIQRSRGGAPPSAPPRGSPQARTIAAPPQPMVPMASPQMATMAINPDPMPNWRNEPATEAAPPPSFGDMGARQAKPSVPPPPMSVEGVRPRIVSAAREQNAAAKSLRQSAAVGETYLNDLLTGGLLDVAGVRVPDADFDLRPDRRWGRSTRRAFVFLFVVLVLGIGGGGTWYWWSQKQKSEAVARLQHESQTAIISGDFAGYEACIKKLGEALEKDKSNVLTYAYLAECTGLEALLYGTDADRVDVALKGVGKDIGPDDPGAREMMFGKAAVELSRLGSGDGSQTAVAQVSKSTLAEVRKSLETFLAKNPNDKWAQWLRGRALLSGGERKGARAQLKAASDGDDGMIVAMIDLADLLVDDGQLDDALQLYDKAALKAKDHPLIVVGRSLGRAEASINNEETIGDLSVKLPKDLPARLNAYRHLATSFANTGIEAYQTAVESLTKATASHPPNEPRFWARVAWAYFMRGDLNNAARARARCVWYGAAKAEDDPAVQLVDAALLLASGLPEKALATAAKLQGIRPQILRAYADLDLGKPKDAQAEVEDVLKKAPDNVEALVLRQEARMIGSEGKDRADAQDKLEKLTLGIKSMVGKHALGTALYMLGNSKDAQPKLEAAIKEMSDEKPNPLVYRTRTTLAEILLANNDLPGAGSQLDEALKVNSGYFPTLALQAKVVLKHGEPDRALEMLKPIFNEVGAVTPQLRLTFAEATVTRKGATAADKESAKAILVDIKDKGVPPGEIGRVAALIDPKLPRELGVPEGGGETPKAPDRHRHR